MTFDHLYQELGKLSQEVRANHDLTVFDNNDGEFYGVSMEIRTDDENADGILDPGHPVLYMTYT